MSNNISLRYVLNHPDEYTLTKAGKEVVGDARIDMKAGLTTLVLGIIGASFMLVMGAGIGGSAFTNVAYWKCWALPVAVMITGLGFMGYGEYQMRSTNVDQTNLWRGNDL